MQTLSHKCGTVLVMVFFAYGLAEIAVEVAARSAQGRGAEGARNELILRTQKTMRRMSWFVIPLFFAAYYVICA